MQEPALDDRTVGDQLVARPHERVDAAERVFPVVLVELRPEHIVGERAHSVEDTRLERGRVSRAQRELWLGAHGTVTSGR